MVTIYLTDCEFFCHVGCSDEERARKQQIFIDVEVEVDTPRAMTSDKLEDAVDYRDIHSAIKEIVEEKPYNLVETMVQNVQNRLVRDFSLKCLTLTLRKPRALEKRGVGEVAVKVTYTQK